ncbi:hypothetical protein [Shewanella frigidimarina]|uniref:hypothetical protein n=1 Tax=Shewanella frigidimarina TaxID=56812 RepID=UPI000F50D6DC|nr:hypothetical protein [Shewanella frigidimarina]RPA23505.1 hypothetical protein EGC78_19425 [Shewanella frigidimarina]
MDSTHKPLDGLPLINDGWVFFFYGWIIASFMARYESVGASITDLENLAMEPFSVGAFFSIASTGFLCVLSTVAFLEYKQGKSIDEIRNNFFLKRIFIPISEVGLSTGAIIIGMSCGIAFKFSSWAPLSEQSDITKVTSSIALMVLMVYWPLFWQQRSILAKGKIENIKFNIIGVLYIIVCGGLIYTANVDLFFIVATIAIVLMALAYYLLVYKKLWSKPKANKKLN